MEYSHRRIMMKQAFATATSSMISFCTGITFGMTAVMLPQLRVDQSIEYNSSHESWIASVSVLTIIIGSLISGQLLDSFGRKAAHFMAIIPCAMGWFVIACANSTSIIIVGRLLTGLSSGANKVVTMVYIAEITDPKLRSIVLFTPSLMQFTGILFSHIVGYYVYWKISAILCICPIILALVAFFFLKESPMWLITRGRIDEGIEKFRWFRGSNETSEAELKKILERQSNKTKMSAKEIFEVVKTKAFIKPMLIIMVVVINIQCTGVNVISFYSLDIFEKAFNDNVDPFVLMITMDCIRTIMSIGICAFGKIIPRRNAFLACSICHSTSVFGLVTCFSTNYDVLWVPVLCLVIYMCFSSAISTIGWTFVPELMPNSARGFGSGINSAVSFIMLFGLVKTTPDILKLYGESVLFACFGLPTLFCAVILCFVLPDTNGKTLQSLEDGYKNKPRDDVETRL